MQGFWWKLPLLRRLSPLRRGLAEAWSVTLLGSLGMVPALHVLNARPSQDLFTAIAQVGATLLVAYGLEISSFLRESRKRSADRENWVGVAAGLGCGGLVGICFALTLSGVDGSLSLFQELVFAVSATSIFLLGLLVALGPLAVHEWVHAAAAEYSDE